MAAALPHQHQGGVMVYDGCHKCTGLKTVSPKGLFGIGEGGCSCFYNMWSVCMFSSVTVLDAIILVHLSCKTLCFLEDKESAVASCSCSTALLI